MVRLQQLLVISLLVMGLFADIGTCSGAATTSPVSFTLKADMVAGTTNTIAFKATLRNNGSEPQRWFYKDENRDFRNYLRKSIRMETNPLTYTRTWQTVEAHRTSSKSFPQLAFTLKANEEVSVDWTGCCGCLDSGDKFICQSKRLSEPGRYELTAYFWSGKDSTPPVRLESEPVKLDFGGSSADPARTVLALESIDVGTSSAILAGGSNQGVKSGQVWLHMQTLLKTWTLTIETVSAESSTGTYTIFQRPTPGLDLLECLSQPVKIGAMFHRAATEKVPDCGQ